MSNTKRKIRRRRQTLEKHWDLVATKATLLGDIMPVAIASYRYICVADGRPRFCSDKYNEFSPPLCPCIWAMEQMNIKPPSRKNLERLRAAMQRLLRNLT